LQNGRSISWRFSFDLENSACRSIVSRPGKQNLADEGTKKEGRGKRRKTGKKRTRKIRIRKKRKEFIRKEKGQEMRAEEV
jgi:hypothetical protein